MAVKYWDTISPLIAGLYEAAVYPSLWESALTQVCAAVEFEAAFLFSSDGESQSSVVTPGGKEVFSKFLAGGWQEKNERMHRMLAKGQHGFVHDYDVFSPDEINKMPIYRDFLHPMGLGFGAGTFVQSPRDHQMILSLERRRERGLVDPETIQILDLIRPHFARAVMLTIEVHKRQAELTLSGLTMIGVPAAIIRDSGRLVATNALFVDLESQLYFEAFDQIRLRDRRADQLFRLALLSVGSDADAAVRSIPLPSSDIYSASIIHIIPLRNEARGLSSNGAAILFVSQARNDDDEPHALLRGLYDLSNAEAKLAACILRGQDIRQASSSLGIKYETARKVSKAVYLKTGSAGQADLIRRVSFVQRV